MAGTAENEKDPRRAPDRADEAAGGTAASTVADELVRLILGQLSPGASLPSEAELAVRHGVSRVTVREAVKMLAGRGLLELARGRRAVVREPDGSAFGEFLMWLLQYDPRAVFDLVEVRQSLEIHSVTLAAKRANRPAIAAIENTIGRMREAAAQMERGHDPEAELRFHEADVGFHEAIALASGNRILTYMFEAMAVPLQKSFVMSRRGRELRGRGHEHTIAMHERVLDCIKRGDARGAAEAMQAHLDDSGRHMRMAFSALPGRP
jgi:DNA-binding FadR family transcriptional regulator